MPSSAFMATYKPRCQQRRATSKPLSSVIHGSKDPVAPKADRDALEAEMDGAGANWQMLDFGGRLPSFAEEETMMKGIAELNSPAGSRLMGFSVTPSQFVITSRSGRLPLTFSFHMSAPLPVTLPA